MMTSWPNFPWIGTALAALTGLLLGRYAWSVACCYARLFHTDETRAQPDALLLWQALRGGLRQVGIRADTGDEPAWPAWLAALVLAAVYALLTVYAAATHTAHVAASVNAIIIASALALAWAASLLLLLALIDARTSLLPDALTLPLLWTGLALALLGVGPIPLPDALAAAMIAYVFLWLFAWLFLHLRGRDGMGGGDVKLLAAIGAWAGWPDVFLALLCASVSGILYALVVARGRHLDAPHPFGPHLAGAAILLLILRATGAMDLLGLGR